LTFCWLNKLYWYCMVFINVLYLPVISLLSSKPTISHREHFSVWLVCVYVTVNVYNQELCLITEFSVIMYNRDHSPNFFRQTSLLFHKWLAERFNLDDAWIVNVGYKNTSISIIPGLIKMSAFDWSMTRWYKTHATGW
jgi:hypothetical protein